MQIGINLSAGMYPTIDTQGQYSYSFATDAELDYFAANGFGNVRFSISWEQIQPALDGPLDQACLQALQSAVSYATGLGLKVILDLHNYGEYAGSMIGSASVPTSAFADFWGKLATEFQNNSNVMFGLMNEPQISNATDWLTSVNAAIAAIRNSGAVTQEILVPGIGWDGADTWTSNGNSAVLGTPGAIVDSANNFAFDVHQYLDAGGAGQTTEVSSPTVGSDRLQQITTWAAQTGARLFLSEVGVGQDALSTTALSNMLSFMQANGNVWQGMSYWAAGASWQNYIYSIEPQYGLLDAPQTQVLRGFGTSSSSRQVTADGSTEITYTSAAGPTLVQIYRSDGSVASVSLYDADGLLDRSVTIAEDGSASLSIYLGLPNGTNEIDTTYTAAGVLLTQHDQMSNGTSTTSYFAADGQTIIEQDDYDQNGQLSSKTLNAADGTHTVDVYGAGIIQTSQSYDAQWKLTQQTSYDNAGLVTSIQIRQSDGLISIYYYSPGGQIPISTATYNSNWNLQTYTVNNSDLSHTVSTFGLINGSSILETVEDYNSNWVLLSRTTYDASGNPTELQVDESNGSHVISAYSLAGSTQPSTVTTYNAAWQMQEADTFDGSGHLISSDTVAANGNHVVAVLVYGNT